jgi:branched-chain amino acid aminotransferase
MKVWIDGEIVDGAAARVPVTDHGYLYGDGIFEGMRVYSRRLFRLDDHMARISVAARAVGLTIPGGIDKLREVSLAAARAHLDETGEQDAYLRLIVSRGEGSLGVDPTTCPLARIVCIADHVRIYPPEKMRSGISLVTSSWRRPPADVLDPRVKSLNYMNNALAKLEARRQGADEALLLNQAGYIAEASVANLFAVREGVLLTPPATDGALEGITRRSILELAQEAGIPNSERTLGRFDVLAASEVFLTGSGAKVGPVSSLDGEPVGKGEAGPITRQLNEAFDVFARSTGTPIDS